MEERSYGWGLGGGRGGWTGVGGGRSLPRQKGVWLPVGHAGLIAEPGKAGTHLLPPPPAPPPGMCGILSIGSLSFWEEDFFKKISAVGLEKPRRHPAALLLSSAVGMGCLRGEQDLPPLWDSLPLPLGRKQ